MTLMRCGFASLAVLRRLLVGEELLHRLAADLGKLALERAHAGLARVVAHDVADRGLGDRELAFLEAGGRHLLGQQVADGDVVP